MSRTGQFSGQKAHSFLASKEKNPCCIANEPGKWRPRRAPRECDKKVLFNDMLSHELTALKGKLHPHGTPGAAGHLPGGGAKEVTHVTSPGR